MGQNQSKIFNSDIVDRVVEKEGTDRTKDRTNLRAVLKSLQLQNEGDVFFKYTYTFLHINIPVVDRLPPAMQISRLDQAIEKYRELFDVTKNEKLKVRALEYIAIASWKISSILNIEYDTMSVKYYLKQAVECFLQLYTDEEPGEPDKSGISDHSTQDLHDLILNCLEDINTKAASLPFQKKISFQKDFIPIITNDGFRETFCMVFAEKTYDDAVDLLDADDFETTLIGVQVCQRSLEEAEKAVKSEDCTSEPKGMFDSEIKEMRRDLRLLKSRAISLQALSIGDTLQENYCATNDDKDILVMVREASPWYEKAVLEAHGIDDDIEEIALTQIKQLYAQVYQLKATANPNLNTPPESPISLQPRKHYAAEYGTAGYRRCVDNLTWYEKEVEQLEDIS